MDSDYLLVTTTFETREDAQRMADLVVEKRLAACAQIVGPIRSTYWWQGKVERAEEWQCLMKTRADRYDALAGAVADAHPYDVPELVATPLVRIAEPYRQWLDDTLKR